jgi:hypothetical protein
MKPRTQGEAQGLRQLPHGGIKNEQSDAEIRRPASPSGVGKGPRQGEAMPTAIDI